MSSKQSQIILVTGATGNQGGAVARHLLQRGFAVRALVRDDSDASAAALKDAGAEIVVGDLDDRDSLDRAARGAHGVFSVQSIQDGLETEIRQGKAIADAAKAAGVSHFVYSSVGSADRDTGVPHFDSKFQIEEHVRASGVTYTILRPVFFLYNYDEPQSRGMIEKGTLAQPLSPDTKLQQLSEDDYGRMVATAFERPEDFSDRAIDVASVEMTMPEVAEAFSRVTGKTVEYKQVPWDDFEKQAGEEMTVMYRWFESTGYDADLAELRREFGESTDLEAYLRDKDRAKSGGSASEAHG